MRYFMISMGLVITVTFLLALLAGPAQARGTAQLPAEDTQPIDATSLIYLGLAGGVTLLAGIAWLKTLRQAQRSITD